MENLSEQQRLLLAVALSVGILLVYQAFFAPDPPATPPEPETTEAPTPAVVEAPVDAPPSEETAPAPESETPEPAPEPSVTVTRSSRSFETDVLRGELSNLDGRLEQIELKTYTELEADDDDTRRPVNLVAEEGAAAHRQARLSFELEGAQAPELAFADAEGLSLVGRNADAEVKVGIEASGYTLRYRIEIANQRASPLKGAATITMGLRQTGEGRTMFAPAADVVSGLCYYDGGVDRDLVASLKDEPVSAASNVQWAGID